MLYKYGSKPIGSAPLMTQGFTALRLKPMLHGLADDTARNGLEIPTVRIAKPYVMKFR